jgi:hypothetical protein
MKNQPKVLESNNNFTRREALIRALKSSIAVAAAAPAIGKAETSDVSETEVEFVPENDYPFFGYEPEEADQS